MYIPIGTLILLLLGALSPTIVIIILKIFQHQDEKKWETAAERAPDGDLFITLYGSTDNWYHTTKECPRLANKSLVWSVNKYSSPHEVGKRYPCIKCCRREKEGIYPKDPFASDY